MHDSLQKFFEAGKSLRTKRRSGMFVLVESDEAVANFLKTCFHDFSGGNLTAFDKPKEALKYLRGLKDLPHNQKSVKCMILNVQVIGIISPTKILEYLEKNNPEVVSIAYTKDVRQAEELANKFPRITMIYNRDGIRTLLESLDVQLTKCGYIQRQRA